MSDVERDLAISQVASSECGSGYVAHQLNSEWSNAYEAITLPDAVR